MSIFSRLIDGLSSVFGGGSVDPNDTAGVLDALSKGTLFGSPSSGSSFGLKEILDLATPLAGTYFEQAQKRSIADAYSQQAMNQIAAEKEKLAADLEAAKISAGASVASANIAAGAAKKNTLANLYSNWAQLAQRTGEAKGQQALATGQSMNEGAIARARVLV